MTSRYDNIVTDIEGVVLFDGKTEQWVMEVFAPGRHDEHGDPAMRVAIDYNPWTGEKLTPPDRDEDTPDLFKKE